MIIKQILLLLLFDCMLLAQSITVSIRLDSTTGEHAYVTNYWPTLNLTPDPDFAGVAWTMSGTPYIGRSLIKFNFNGIDSGVTVTNAFLSLFGNPFPLHSPGHQIIDGSNSCYLRKVISNWNQYLVTWNNQPSIGVLNQVILPQSNSQTQNYNNINVTNLVRDMINHPSGNFGFIIMLLTEQHYRALNFASSHCLDSAKRPKLTITYTPPIGIINISNDIPNNYALHQNYPNPFNPSTKIKFDIPPSPLERVGVRLIIYDILGREVTTLVNETLKPGTYEVEFDGSSYASGVYFYQLITDEFTQTNKMILIK